MYPRKSQNNPQPNILITNLQPQKSSQLTLQQIATSTLQQFSQESPRVLSFQRNRQSIQHQRKNPKISTWHSDTEYKPHQFKSPFPKRDRNKTEEQIRSMQSSVYEAPTNMLLQLTNSLKFAQPKYTYKLKQKKNTSINYVMQKQEFRKKTLSTSRTKLNCSSHIIPCPHPFEHQSKNQQMIRYKKDTGTAIKKIKSDIISSFSIKHRNEKNNSQEQKKEKVISAHRDVKLNSFYQSGIFKASIVIKQKKKHRIQTQSPLLMSITKRKSQNTSSQTNHSQKPISASRQFQLLQNLIELQKI